MSDEYPTEWGYRPPTGDEIMIADRRIASLRSGLHADPVERSHLYPPEWK